MNTYEMTRKHYHDIWYKLEEIKDKDLHYRTVDRWLSIRYGLTWQSQTAAESNIYKFNVKDDEKLLLFLLKWS